jgi:hypothetical protein
MSLGKFSTVLETPKGAAKDASLFPSFLLWMKM